MPLLAPSDFIFPCPPLLTSRLSDSGALEPQFFAQLLGGLGLSERDLPGRRDDPSHWPRLRDLFIERFKGKTRSEWEAVFDGTDACCTPVLSQSELEHSGFVQRPAVSLDTSPARAIGVSNPRRSRDGQGDGVQGRGWTGQVISSGPAGRDLLREWTGLQLGTDIAIVDGSFEMAPAAKL